MKNQKKVLKKSVLVLSIMVMSFVLLSGCSGKKDVPLPRQMEKPKAGDEIAIIKTSEGEFKMKLLSDVAPKTVEAFKKIVETKYYEAGRMDKRPVSHIIMTFNPEDDKTFEEFFGSTYVTETANDVRHYTGAVGMARKGESEPSGEFYIVATEEMDQEFLETMDDLEDLYPKEVRETYDAYGGEPRIDLEFTVFAQVYEGMDVVDAIFKIEHDEYTFETTKEVTIESIEIKTFDGK